MKRMTIVAVAVCLMYSALPAGAQEEGGMPPPFAREFEITVRQGHEKAFVEAYKGHVAWHVEQKDDWQWDTWQQVSGPNLNTFVIRTGGITLADLDAKAEFSQADGAHYRDTVGEHVAHLAGSTTITRFDLSHFTGEWVPKFATVFEFDVRYGSEDEFLQALAMTKLAAGEGNWPVNYLVLQTLNGAPSGKFVVVLPHASWADMAPPEKSFRDMLDDGLGKERADLVRKLFEKSVEKQLTTLWAYRADLSYIPAGM